MVRKRKGGIKECVEPCEKEGERKKAR